jgi:hypothetical protein
LPGRQQEPINQSRYSQSNLSPPPQKEQPRIDVIQIRDREPVGHVLFVRDPSSGEFKPLTREEEIPVVKGHIEFHVKKLKEAKDDKSVREALKGLEESVQNMKELLGFPEAPGAKKPEDKKPGRGAITAGR